MPSDLTTLTASELRQQIGRKAISPVELLTACIERIERLNPLVNAVTATCYERALLEARAAERAVMRGEPLGLLHGLPIGVKDLEPTQGLLTTLGTPAMRSHVPTVDIELVKRLRAAGGIVLAKTNVPELGAGANTRNPVWGATGNPFNPNLNAGGSSGGSAAALALDLLPICTGSDTGGSLRIPAALCGVVGMRPSPGLVPSVRKPLGWSPISVVGPMGRNIADTCLQLAATAGSHPGDPLSYPVNPLDFLHLPGQDLSKLRVAWTEDFDCCDVDPMIRRSFRQKVAAIAPAFGRCDPVHFSSDFDVHRCFDILRAEAFVAGMREAYERDPEALGTHPRSNYEMGASLTLGDLAWAQAEQTRLLASWQSIFAEYDLILSPTTPVSPFPWTQAYCSTIDGKAQDNYYRWLALTYVVTLITHPALSLPCGVDEAGLPFGMQVIAPFRGDALLLSTCTSLERLFSAHDQLRRPRPDIAKLAPADPALRSIVTHPPSLSAPNAQDGTNTATSVV